MEGDLARLGAALVTGVISIHTLRMEGDSLLPFYYSVLSDISIHTLRMEGDPALLCYRSHGSNFNPHPPRGG